jgi:Homeobox KN domain
VNWGWTSSIPAGNSSIDSGYSSLSATPIGVNEGLPPIRAAAAAEPGAHRASKSGTVFDPRTVRILETWYSANLRHPYPSDAVLTQLADDGGITIKQARKWLANRRVRSFNTLTYNGAIHPKRLGSLQRRTRRLPQQLPRPPVGVGRQTSILSPPADERTLTSATSTAVNDAPMLLREFGVFPIRLSSTSNGSQLRGASFVDRRHFPTPGDGSVQYQISLDVVRAQSAAVAVRSAFTQSAWTSAAMSSLSSSAHWPVQADQVTPSSSCADHGHYER